MRMLLLGLLVLFLLSVAPPTDVPASVTVTWKTTDVVRITWTQTLDGWETIYKVRSGVRYGLWADGYKAGTHTIEWHWAGIDSDPQMIGRLVNNDTIQVCNRFNQCTESLPLSYRYRYYYPFVVR